MRDIKFRGKTNSGTWLIGDLMTVNSIAFIAPKDGDWFDFIPLVKRNVFHAPSARFMVVKDSIGQFTGIKTLDGLDVYEGDVVKVPASDFNAEFVGVVKYDTGSFVIKSVLSGLSCSLDYCFRERMAGSPFCKVIGNVYDNPDLTTKRQ